MVPSPLVSVQKIHIHMGANFQLTEVSESHKQLGLTGQCDRSLKATQGGICQVYRVSSMTPTPVLGYVVSNVSAR